ncbi:hypothetical protein V1478_018652 [Vespula squamosa]|uniref:Uncharacterized protein n=1 Tax=Vespula squamosa TaxID=30214 RepID=A0ABD1ZTE6_VESSQ
MARLRETSRFVIFSDYIQRILRFRRLPSPRRRHVFVASQREDREIPTVSRLVGRFLGSSDAGEDDALKLSEDSPELVVKEKDFNTSRYSRWFSLKDFYVSSVNESSLYCLYRDRSEVGTEQKRTEEDRRGQESTGQERIERRVFTSTGLRRVLNPNANRCLDAACLMNVSGPYGVNLCQGINYAIEFCVLPTRSSIRTWVPRLFEVVRVSSSEVHRVVKAVITKAKVRKRHFSQRSTSIFSVNAKSCVIYAGKRHALPRESPRRTYNGFIKSLPCCWAAANLKEKTKNIISAILPTAIIDFALTYETPFSFFEEIFSEKKECKESFGPTFFLWIYLRLSLIAFSISVIRFCSPYNGPPSTGGEDEEEEEEEEEEARPLVVNLLCDIESSSFLSKSRYFNDRISHERSIWVIGPVVSYASQARHSCHRLETPNTFKVSPRVLSCTAKSAFHLGRNSGMSDDRWHNGFNDSIQIRSQSRFVMGEMG